MLQELSFIDIRFLAFPPTGIRYRKMYPVDSDIGLSGKKKFD